MARFGRYWFVVLTLSVGLSAYSQTSPIIVGAERLAMAVDGKASAAEGRALYRELGCTNCHDLVSGRPDTKFGPDLTKVTERITLSYLRDWLSSPHETKPGTTMPDLFAALSKADRDATVDQLLHYFVSRGERFQPDGNPKFSDEMLKRGEDLYHTVGCVACHAPRREPTARVGGNDEFSERIVTYESVKLPSVPLPELRMKTNHGSLSEFLLDPHAVRPSGRMPNMKLSPGEAKDIAAYLLTDPSETPVDVSSFQVNGTKARIGEMLFDSIGCARCHAMQSETLKSHSFTFYPKKDLNAGCLATSPIPRTAWYGLSTRQRESIHLYLTAPDPYSEKRDIESRIASLNCYACHERDGIGGIEAGRNPYFSATIEADLGDEGRIPPTLTGVGAKLTKKGLTSVLLEDGTVRPYMATRMPRFGEEHVGHLAEALLIADENPAPLPVDVSGLEHHHRNIYGRQLMGTEGFGCVSCHNLYGTKSLGIPAIDLATVPERIQPSWFKEYLLDPSALRSGTRMPTFFEAGKSPITRVLRGDANQQIEALWIYLREIDQTRLPEGMEGTENYELVPTDQPIILRTFMKDVGTHAIVVGYPEGTHIAFDALNVRLAMAWRGKFIDAESTWADRFSPLAEPLSDTRIPTPAGMPFTFSPDESNYLGVDAGYRFGGYRLDDNGQPIFMYSITDEGDTISIEERITVSENGEVERKFGIAGNELTRLYLHLGTEDEKPIEIAPSEGTSTLSVIWNPIP